ncbi:hypothetical protein M404DRAFT_737441 [Pisolithus tinctorius Marx 270]|uniref:Uncharacterized protein n=1 Tax=Pisolithus tinctorius Marx 270 TaxID=870435 RepID=A0A0C3NJT5_PISTI|nr:hypothetical protein M404DRAFT_737441 [Pisolithus tinctorius Marx 270]
MLHRWATELSLESSDQSISHLASWTPVPGFADVACHPEKLSIRSFCSTTTYHAQR